MIQPVAPKEPPATVEESGALDYISASRLKMFSECRLKFYFRYVAGVVKPPVPALFVGTAVHAVLQQWNLRRWRGEPADVDTLRGFFADYWQSEAAQSGIDWQGEEDKFRDQAWRVLCHYLEQTPIPLDERPEAVEVKVERDFIAAGLPPLVGVIDLVRSGGRIVDFKTAARAPDALMAEHLNEIQLCCYAVLYREATVSK